MSYCSNCGTELEAGANFCPGCGAAVGKGKRQSGSRASHLTDTEYSDKPTENAVRRGVTNAKFNEQMSSVLIYEIIAVAVAIGLITESWWWGGGAFLGLIVLVSIPSTGMIISMLFGVAWGAVGYFVGGALFGESASWVIAGIAGLCGYGANEAGRQYLEDLGT